MIREKEDPNTTGSSASLARMIAANKLSDEISMVLQISQGRQLAPH